MLWMSIALAADWSALADPSGWELVATGSHEHAEPGGGTSPIEIRLKTIDGTRCLQGTTVVGLDRDVLYDVVTDVPAAKDFSSETLLAAEVLGRDGKSVDYYQHLDVPGWTMANDRFWVLRGTDTSAGDVRSFRWERFDWRTAYPELAKRIEADHKGSVEPDPNYGSWRFEPADGKTRAVYTLCSNPGGSLPEWVQKAAATRTLPGTIGDVMREAGRRQSSR
ncbi:MAG: hypothetical protein H6737_06705 [Alphaproteobacteria bacterium]|nr:hypothetical protein [Alphaproteobacteria bacterium]